MRKAAALIGASPSNNACISFFDVHITKAGGSRLRLLLCRRSALPRKPPGRGRQPVCRPSAPLCRAGVHARRACLPHDTVFGSRRRSVFMPFILLQNCIPCLCYAVYHVIALYNTCRPQNGTGGRCLRVACCLVCIVGAACMRPAKPRGISRFLATTAFPLPCKPGQTAGDPQTPRAAHPCRAAYMRPLQTTRQRPANGSNGCSFWPVGRGLDPAGDIIITATSREGPQCDPYGNLPRANQQSTGLLVARCGAPPCSIPRTEAYKSPSA